MNLLNMSEDELAHYGVRGMRWGKRKGADRTERAMQKADQKWVANSPKNSLAVYNRGAEQVNAKNAAFNDQPKYKDKDLTKDPKLYKQYLDDYTKFANEQFNDAAVNSGLGTSPSGKLRMQWEFSVNEGFPTATIVENY